MTGVELTCALNSAVKLQLNGTASFSTQTEVLLCEVYQCGMGTGQLQASHRGDSQMLGPPASSLMNGVSVLPLS